jgi:hypothetical protein
MQKFEIIGIDPETGDEDSLISEGTHAKMQALLDEMIADFFASDEWDGRIETYPVYRLQPAA